MCVSEHSIDLSPFDLDPGRRGSMPGNCLVCAPDIYGREPEIYCGSQERVAAKSD